jgi:Tfp pilus assembly protein PilV
METLIVVVLLSVIVLGTLATGWYTARNIKHYRDEVADADLKWRRDRDQL